MLALALKSIRANWARLLATVVAIVIGVGFLGAGRMLTAAVSESLRSTTSEEFAAVSAVVRVPRSDDDVASSQVPASVVDEIRSVPAVDAAAGRVEGTVALIKDGLRVEDSNGRNWVRDDALNPLELLAGRTPRAGSAGEREVVLDEDLARKADSRVGQSVKLATAAGLVKVKVVGISHDARTNLFGSGATVSFSDAGAFAIVNSGKDAFDDVLVRGTGSDESVVSAVTDVVPPGLEVESGDSFRDSEGDLAAGIADVLSPVLQVFGFLTLFVCGFVIYNTFSVVIAQRQRELALLRAIGATPKQVRRSVRLEGLAVGVIGSVSGLVFGALFAKGLQLVLAAAGINLPGSGVVITLPTVLICVGVGTLVTVCSVLPAGRRAARTAPVEALRAAQTESPRLGTGRVVTGLVLVVGGGLLLLAATAMDVPGRIIAASALGFMVGVFVAGPAFAQGLGRVLRRPLSALGFEGRLADDGLGRNPRRASTTANALVIGVFLVTVVTVSGTSIRTWAVARVNELSSADFTLTADGGAIPAPVIRKLEKTQGVETVAPLVNASANLDGVAANVTSGDAALLADAADIEVDEGSLDDLGADGIAVLSLLSDRAIGDTVTLRTVDGATREMRVAAVLKFGISTLGVDNLISPEAFAALFGDAPPETVFVRAQDGEFDAVNVRIDRIVAPYANISVQEGNAIARLVGDILTFFVNAVNALLLVAILVALVGIVNTLSLAIIERRREFGLLRAVGMTPVQVRSSVRIEALMISGLGTAVGMVAGMLLGVVFVSSIGISSVLGTVDWWRVVVIAVGGIVVGVLAALIPTWAGHAARHP